MGGENKPVHTAWKFDCTRNSEINWDVLQFALVWLECGIDQAWTFSRWLLPDVLIGHSRDLGIKTKRTFVMKCIFNPSPEYVLGVMTLWRKPLFLLEIMNFKVRDLEMMVFQKQKAPFQFDFIFHVWFLTSLCCHNGQKTCWLICN